MSGNSRAKVSWSSSRKRGATSRGKAMHALAGELVGHVAEVELDQEVADLGLLENLHDAPIDRVGAADDDRRGLLKVVPVLGIAKQRRGRIGELQIVAEFLRWNVGDAGAKGELAAFAAQMSLQAVLEEVPDAFLGFGLRLRVGVADIGRHQDAHAERLIAVAVLLEDARRTAAAILPFPCRGCATTGNSSSRAWRSPPRSRASASPESRSADAAAASAAATG